MTLDEKFELMDYLIFQQSKMQKLSLRLLVLGEDHAEVDKREKELARQLKDLRVKMMASWQVDATALMADLRNLNDLAQRRVRQLQDAQDRVAKVAEIVGFIDRGLAAVAGIVA